MAGELVNHGADSGAENLRVEPVRGIGASATSATGANTYATVITTGEAKTHIAATVSTNGAVISLDGGVTDSIILPAGAAIALDNIYIASGAVIQAKNLTAASNYVNLYINVW